MGNKLRQKRFFTAGQAAKSPMDETRDLLATTVLAHVSVSLEPSSFTLISRTPLGGLVLNFK